MGAEAAKQSMADERCVARSSLVDVDDGAIVELPPKPVAVNPTGAQNVVESRTGFDRIESCATRDGISLSSPSAVPKKIHTRCAETLLRARHLLLVLATVKK